MILFTPLSRSQNENFIVAVTDDSGFGANKTKKRTFSKSKVVLIIINGVNI